MKKLSSMFAVLAFVFAIGVSFADVLMQTDGYYDNNGTDSGGAVGPVDLNGDVSCGDSGSIICKIGIHNAFDTAPNAEANGGSSNTNAVGLLKRN